MNIEIKMQRKYLHKRRFSEITFIKFPQDQKFGKSNNLDVFVSKKTNGS